MKQTIGFIGQGWIGKHYADDFEHRGYEVVRYSLEEPYIKNKEKLSACTIIFIAVPTPTTPTGFSYEPVRDSLKSVPEGAIAVIKSTILPGTTKMLQEEFPNIFVMHSPEFLREASAAYDASHPDRNIIGVPVLNDEYTRRAKQVLAVLPKANFEAVMNSLEAEMVKYVGNCFLYSKVVMMNTFYDMVSKAGANWDVVREAMVKDPRIGESHTNPVHNSGHDTSNKKDQRGAGGHCFIKDFESFRQFQREIVGNDLADQMLTAMINYNNHLLIDSSKDIDLLEGVYGGEVVSKSELVK